MGGGDINEQKCVKVVKYFMIENMLQERGEWKGTKQINYFSVKELTWTNI